MVSFEMKKVVITFDVFILFWKHMKSLDAIMSLKIRFLHPQLGFFPFNCGDVSNEHGEKFLQDIAVMEKRY